MEKCEKCGGTLPAGATSCPNCGHKVLSGTVAAQSDTVTGKKQITAASPEGNGTAQVPVTIPGDTTTASTADQFTYVPIPMETDVSPRVAQAGPRIGSGPGYPIMIVMNVSPNTGPVAGGTLVLITGAGFTGASQVLFGTVPATSFRVLSDYQIVALSPASSVGSSMVQVTVISPGTSPADRFTYKPAGPVIGGISPKSGPTTGGTRVIITGQFFTGASQVLFGTVPASNVTVSSDTQITVTSPASSVGTVHVTVTTPGGPSATSAADQFTYLPVPTVTLISPNTGPAAGGTFVTIIGTGFTPDSQVRFGSVAASNVMVSSATQITAVSPAGSGAVDVRVTTPGGTSAATNADRFNYVYAPPMITGFSPTTGPTTGGTVVTITGTGYTGVTQVLFGTVPATILRFSYTQITAVSPAHSVGPVDVKVTTPGGTSATSIADLFTYLPVPTVTGVLPHTAPAAGGTFVTITGTGFTPDSQVRFGSVAASNVTVNSSTQITVTSPPGSAGTVHVTVTTPGGTSATSAADQFTYI